MIIKQTNIFDLLSPNFEIDGDNSRIEKKIEKFFLIPIYQREYQWETFNCKILLEDLINIGKKNDNDPSTHFTGMMLFEINKIDELENERKKYYEVIDGQQRLLTSALIIRAIIKKAEELDLTIDKQLEELILHKSNNIIKIKPGEKDRSTFNDILNNENISNETNLGMNFNEFLKRLNSKDDIEAAYKGLKKMTIAFIEIDKDKGDDAQEIFERMNSTGKPLCNADKIRNYLLMGFDEETREQLYEYWKNIESNLKNGNNETLRKNLENFVFDYVRMKKETKIDNDDIYSAFKSYVNNHMLNNNRNINEAKKDILKDLKKFSEYYKDYIGDLNANVKCDDYRYLLYELRAMNHTTPYPFLLRIEDELRGSDKWESTFGDIIDLISIYIVRRALSNVSTSSLSNFFLTLHKNIFTNNKNVDKKKYYEIIYCYFEKISGRDAMPDDRKIKDNSTIVDLYKNKVLLPVLSSIENGRYKYNKSNERERIFGNCSNQNTPSIEHIMPQDIENSNEWKEMLSLSTDKTRHFDPYEVHKRLLNTIGNLTILTTKFNSSSSNNSYSKKVEIIKKGIDDGLIEYKTLNNYVYDYPLFNGESIEKRGKELINKILSMYPFKNGKFKNDYTFGSANEEVINNIKDINPKYFCDGKELIKYKLFEGFKICSSFRILVENVILELYRKDKEKLLDIINNKKELLEKNSIELKTSISKDGDYYFPLNNDLYIWNNVNADYEISYLLTLIKVFGEDPNKLELVIKNRKQCYTCYKYLPIQRSNFILDNVITLLNKKGDIILFGEEDINKKNTILYFSTSKIETLLKESRLIDDLNKEYINSGVTIRSPLTLTVRFNNFSKSANKISLFIIKNKNNEKLYNKLIDKDDNKEKMYFCEEFFDWNIEDNIEDIQKQFLEKIHLIEKFIE